MGVGGRRGLGVRRKEGSWEKRRELGIGSWELGKEGGWELGVRSWGKKGVGS
uniref:Uncharacterized protein n=1 Tax=Desertifilum tharense IPPAS B-1220 TaxID=1781255 RepID=A0ACD5H257_9CYAN